MINRLGKFPFLSEDQPCNRIIICQDRYLRMHKIQNKGTSVGIQNQASALNARYAIFSTEKL